MRPIYVLLPSLLLLILSGCDLSSSSDSGSSGTDSTGVDPIEQIPNAATDWLKENGHALDTTDPESNLDDLEPLRQIVGDARVVSLGEATHGTSEFFRMKHRILRFLVKEMGFTAFAIEASMPASFKVNEHVQAGTGNPDERLEGLDFWIWNTQEVLNQIRWMRDYNQAQNQNVGFYGFDMQVPKIAIDVVVDFIENVDPDEMETIQDQYSCYRRYVESVEFEPDSLIYENAPDSTQQRCRRGVKAASELLDEKRDAYVNRTSEREFSFARQHARILVQNEKLKRDAPRGFRDAAMARNVQWLLDYLGPDSKIVLWAHNAHVSEVDREVPFMGAHLDETLGEDLVSFGFSFLKGKAQFREHLGSGQFSEDPKALDMPPPPDSSPTSYYEYYFASADASPFLLDLRLAQKGTDESGWVYGPKKIRSIGGAYFPDRPPERFFYKTNLVSEYDAMIYIEQSTPSDLLRFD